MTELETKLKKAEDLLLLIDEGLTKKDFVDSFEKVVQLVQSIQKGNEKEFELMNESIRLLGQKLKEDTNADVSTLKQQVQDLVSEQIDKITAKLLSVKDGTRGDKGDKGDSIQGLPGKNGSPDKPVEIRNKLETLEGEERLDASAIKNIPVTEKTQVGGFQLIGGSRGIQLMVGGVKKGLVKTLNLIAGTNLTITYTQSFGRNDLLFDATGGSAGFTKLVATGTIDGVNAGFTFLSKPTLIISDGAVYQENKGWTWSGLTATLTIPPSFDIYALL